MPGFCLWLLHIEVRHRGLVVLEPRVLHVLELCPFVAEGRTLVVRKTTVLEWSTLETTVEPPVCRWLTAVEGTALLRQNSWVTSATGEGASSA
jgi:hypothetical protein